jgi:peroxiredoxin
MKALDVVAVAALAMALMVAPAPASAQAVVGQAAPAFTLVDSHGQSRSLADFHGRTVVLEWWNHQCPFVNKHYGSGHMQQLQKEWTGQGIVWLTISSSGPGKQGYVDGPEANALMDEKGGSPTAVLLDHDGAVGRAWGARTTPHMFIVGADGTVLYAGGIDDTPSTDLADIDTAHNYVQAALQEITAGQPVTTSSSEPYGCGVKYAD